jgi:DNA-binding response OmpR family regulator
MADLMPTMTGRKLLLVDDDSLFRQSLAEQLRLEEGFSTIEAASGDAALAAVATENFDLILLDVTLGDSDGREICRRMRGQGVTAPVIMLTGSDADSDTIRGLDSGANDYVTKPVRIGVLLARIRAQLRAHEHNDTAVLSIGPYSFRPATKQLVHAETKKKIRLTEKETAILKYLYRAGRAVGREELLTEVWGYNSGVTTHTLETHVYRLRQKIEVDPSLATMLVTAQSGYQLIP